MRGTASTISRAAATAARSFDGISWGAPKTTITPSPWNSTTAPPWERTMPETVSVYWLTAEKISDALRDSENPV